jgi:hypothetical protein
MRLHPFKCFKFVLMVDYEGEVPGAVIVEFT